MDVIFEDVGKCGCFQVGHVLTIQFVRIISAWVLFLMVFGIYEPPWHCIKHDHLINFTSPDQRIKSNATQVNEFSAQNNAATNGNNISHFITNNSLLLIQSSRTTEDNNATKFQRGTCDELAFCDDVRFAPTSVTVVSDFGLICDKAYVPSVIIAVQMIGMVVGAYLGGQCGELFGRKKNYFSSLAILSIATLAASWSTVWQMHAALSFFIGLGGGSVLCTHLVYAMEFLSQRWRGRVGAIPSWNLSLLLFGAMITGLKNWRHLYRVCGSLGSACLLGALWIPESLRWLYVHGRETESKEVLVKMMKFNRRHGNVSEILTKLVENTKNEEAERKYTYLDLFRTSEIRSLTIKAATVWFFVNMGYYTLSFSVKALAGDFYTNLFLSFASELPFTLLLGPCVIKLGRKFTMSFFTGLAAVSILICIIANYTMSHELSDLIIKYSIIVAKASVGVGWTAMHIFCVELFPTVVRNLAIGLLTTFARLGGIIASVLIPRDHDSTIICLLVLCGAMFLSSSLVISLPETKHKPLEDRIINSDTEMPEGKTTEL